ncbi:MAG: hypothetical protein FJW39_11730 [Acidobacteria bacterium]|nr:hypothetical protein [Acidobacteriota bacterium]
MKRIVAGIVAMLVGGLAPAVIVAACDMMTGATECCKRKCTSDSCFTATQSVPVQVAAAKAADVSPARILVPLPEAVPEPHWHAPRPDPAGRSLYLRNRVLLI